MSVSTETAARQVAPRHDVTEADARQVAESARETTWAKPSFARELFLGRLRLDLIDPVPGDPDPEEASRASAFLSELSKFCSTIDADEIDRTHRVPPPLIDELRRLGAFGIKIPAEYGGLGLSQASYNRAIGLIGTKCSALGVLLSAHQSIGVPEPLKRFGTPDQKRRYLPRLARGAISAFALTESDVGSDPARMLAIAQPTEDGSAYILNGEKLWCTNGPIAELMVVMARTPPRDGNARPGITAFIVESSWPGVEVVHRLEFMGLKGIENGVLRFSNVRVPRENVLWGEGKGLKLALITLNTGRLTIPSMAAAAGKWCLRVSREWAAERVQWGAPVGRHDAIAQKLGNMAATTFAMESISETAAAMADGATSDIRLEAALAKMFNSESAWRVVDACMQIRGGRGYETARSLEARGERPIAVERAMRDLRINLIFEGSSEIMRLFIAREAVDTHLSRAGRFVDPLAPVGARLRGALSLASHLVTWAPRLLVGRGNVVGAYSRHGMLARHVRYIERASRRLARNLLYAMVRFGPGLEKRQAILFRLVEIGAELFAMAATVARSRALGIEGGEDPQRLADLFCRHSRRRVEVLFDQLFSNDDGRTYEIAQDALKGDFQWLESGIPQS